MSVWQAMHQLEEIGYKFYIGETGRAIGYIDGDSPAEADFLLREARLNPAKAAAYVRYRAAHEKHTLPEALAIGQAVKAGKAKLLGKVIFHRNDLSVTMRWEPLWAEDPEILLEKYLGKLKRALERQMEEVLKMPTETMTADEIEASFERYGQCMDVYERL